MLRKAICAGTWYPQEKKEILKYLDTGAAKQRTIAGICPHAGWIYSGKTAGEVYSRLEPSDIYILIGPNHTGSGSPVSLFDQGEWETPLGNLGIEEELAKEILDNSELIKADPLAHIKEHSLEVQMPFIKVLNPEAKILPICLADYRPQVCRELGETIAKAVKNKKLTNKITLIASTDMSHYVSRDIATKFDNMAIEKISVLDPEGLLEVVRKNSISMCGSGPVAAVLWASKELGAKTAKLIKYSNSGDVTGDYSQVVGYAGFIIS